MCDRNGISPTRLYQWQKVFFEHGTAAFERAGNGRKDSPDKKLEKKVSHLQTKLAHKDEVIADIMASHVALKKGSSQEFVHDLHRRNAFFAFWATSRIRIGLGYTKPFLLFSHQSVKRETISD